MSLAHEMRGYMDLLESTAVQTHAAFYLEQAKEQQKRVFGEAEKELDEMVAGELFAGHRLAEQCGSYIGGGLTRNVYENAADNNTVIKFGPGSQTETEYEMWQFVQGTEIEPWFAPVTDYEYPYLVQVKTEMLDGSTAGFPSKLPNIFKFLDPWLENFSRLNGKIVCHDYGWTDGKPVAELMKMPDAFELVAVTEVGRIVRLGYTAKEQELRDEHAEYMRNRGLGDFVDEN